ncbi:TetR/AcrR family transcriptional regulator [Gorillibacterium timonense]|uniref:TetR/AcrR family transcriptional regulator n=1 Tax=Gorillibacterium timonense TaxID=1689269 RepID=UPI00071C57EF|nr:TetR/AcrR family transcriptional regulator [Gorillibacterium timonense]
MGTKDRKESEREIRRTAILDAAGMVFARKGYTNATMDDVSREAEYSKRTVYVYYSSKEQIYLELMIRGYRRMLGLLSQEVTPVAENSFDALMELRHIARTLYRFSTEYPFDFQAIVEYETGERDFAGEGTDKPREDLYALGETALVRVQDTLERGVREKQLRSDLHVPTASLLLWSSLFGVLSTASRKGNYLRHYYSLTPEDFVEEACRLLTDALLPARGADQA